MVFQLDLQLSFFTSPNYPPNWSQSNLSYTQHGNVSIVIKIWQGLLLPSFHKDENLDGRVWHTSLYSLARSTFLAEWSCSFPGHPKLLPGPGPSLTLLLKLFSLAKHMLTHCPRQYSRVALIQILPWPFISPVSHRYFEEFFLYLYRLIWVISVVFLILIVYVPLYDSSNKDQFDLIFVSLPPGIVPDTQSIRIVLWTKWMYTWMSRSWRLGEFNNLTFL